MTYISMKDTAKFIRQTLKLNFPGVRFSVRGKSYSGGSSIRVSWTDGPRRRDVEKVVKFYEGSSFDPSIDLKSSVSQMLVAEDGSIEEISFLNDYVFCERDYSEEYKNSLEAQIIADMASVGLTYDRNTYYREHNTFGSALVRQYGEGKNFFNKEI